MAQTWADYITYDMEHSPYEIGKLADFMRGLVKGGPTRSGTPAVIVSLTHGRHGRSHDPSQRVIALACKTNKIFFLNSVKPADVVDMIKEGVMIGSGAPQAAEIGRQYTKRTMPMEVKKAIEG